MIEKMNDSIYNTIDITTLITNVISRMISHEVTDFDCSFKKDYIRYGETEIINKNIIVVINDLNFIFARGVNDDVEENVVYLIDVDGDTKSFGLENILSLVNGCELLFIDDLYEGIFDDINFDEIFIHCLNNSCKCFICDNLICTLKTCQSCKNAGTDCTYCKTTYTANTGINYDNIYSINITDTSQYDDRYDVVNDIMQYEEQMIMGGADEDEIEEE